MILLKLKTSFMALRTTIKFNVNNLINLANDYNHSKRKLYAVFIENAK